MKDLHIMMDSICYHRLDQGIVSATIGWAIWIVYATIVVYAIIV